MKLLMLSVLIALQLTVAGCASYYSAPANKPTAVMSFQTNMRPVMVQIFEDETCKSGKNGSRLAYIDPVFVKDGKYAGPVRVEADKLTVFTLRKNNLPGDAWSCAVTLSFTPEAGAEYIASFVGQGGKCSAKFARKAGGELETVDDLRQIKKVCYNPNS